MAPCPRAGLGFLPRMKNSRFRTTPSSAGPQIIDGALDAFDYVDGMPGLMPHPRPRCVPSGAPIVVEGWCLDAVTGQPPAAVWFVVDGVQSFVAESGRVRRDIASRRRNTPETVGYRSVISTSGLEAGAHEVCAFATTSGGVGHPFESMAFQIVPVPRPDLPVIPVDVHVHVDSIRAIPSGQQDGFGLALPLGGVAVLSGFVVNKPHRPLVAGVVACDAAGGMWSAPCDTEPAICSGGGSDERAGFEIVVPTEALGRGRHDLRIRSFGVDGSLFRGETATVLDIAGRLRPFPTLALQRHDEPAAVWMLSLSIQTAPLKAFAPGVFDLATARDAFVHIEGWALDASLRGASAITIEVASDAGFVRRFPALAGFRDARAPGALPAPPVEDGWFAGRIDTASLPPQIYSMFLAIIEEDRRTFARLHIGTLRVDEHDSS